MRTLDMRVFRAVVVRVEDVTPSLRRVVLGGPGLADFESTGVGDEYLRILFPAEGQTEPELPRIVDGNLDWGSIDLAWLRTYTVRHHDPNAGEVTIDFVVHEGGVASTWARTAQPGEVVVVNSPTGMYEPASDLDWQVLVADCSSLPALARLVEQARARGVRTRAVIEVPGPGHEIDLPGCEVTWVHGGNGHGPSRLPEVVRSLTRPSGAGHVWVAGESKALRAVRRHLRHDLGLPASAYKTVGYWIEDAELWRSRYDALDDDTRGALEALWLSDRDGEEIEDEYDERLTALGL